MTEANKRGTTDKVVPKEVVIKLYKSSDKVYSRSVSGIFNTYRWVFVWLTQLFFYGVPWLQWNGRQALLFDLDDRRFYIWGLILNPQDLIYLTFLLIISALALFLFTAVAGRLWCGFTCPQTVYTEIYMWMENKIEGDRIARMKLDKAPWSLTKLYKKSFKQFSWITFGLWTGVTFVGYFTPIRELVPQLIQFQASGWNTFWVLFYGFATYGNAGYMREQVCKYMCPYARFQSAMFDDDTLIVTYDKERGEPRGSRPKSAGEHEGGKGSCIDCNICVQVCPTGIDIRNGLQYECISCGLCIDACDSVMDKMGYERGLIKMTTPNGLENKWTRSKIIKRILRPRVLIYSAILWLLIIGMTVSLYLKDDFNVTIDRDRSMLGRISSEGRVENVYNFKIQNAAEVSQSYSVKLTGLKNSKINVMDGESSLKNLSPLETRFVVIEVTSGSGAESPGSHPITFVITNDKGETVTEKSVFMVPLD